MGASESLGEKIRQQTQPDPEVVAAREAERQARREAAEAELNEKISAFAKNLEFALERYLESKKKGESFSPWTQFFHFHGSLDYLPYYPGESHKVCEHVESLDGFKELCNECLRNNVELDAALSIDSAHCGLSFYVHPDKPFPVDGVRIRVLPPYRPPAVQH